MQGTGRLAHELHPGSFSIAEAYVKGFTRRQAVTARKVLQEVVNAYVTVRAAGRLKRLLGFAAGLPVLPKQDKWYTDRQ